MLEVKNEHGQLLKQAKPPTALVALKTTQSRREGGSVTMEINLDFKLISQLCIIILKIKCPCDRIVIHYCVHLIAGQHL